MSFILSERVIKKIKKIVTYCTIQQFQQLMTNQIKQQKKYHTCL